MGLPSDDWGNPHVAEDHSEKDGRTMLPCFNPILSQERAHQAEPWPATDGKRSGTPVTEVHATWTGAYSVHPPVVFVR